MDATSPDPIERLSQIARGLREPGAAPDRERLASIADALDVIAEQLDAERNPQ